MLAFLAKVIRTESGQMRDRLRAVELLAKMCGWNQPEKFEHGASNELTELLEAAGRVAWIAVPPTVEAYLRTYPNTRSRAGASASASRWRC
jgi:hypothetical protein